MIAGYWLFQHRNLMPAFFAALLLPAAFSFEFVHNDHSSQVFWELGCLAISLCGIFFRSLTVAYIREGSSGRELSAPQAERLNTSGLYSVVRNPLYLGNMVIWFGIVSVLHLWWLSGLILLISYVYHRAIISAEETYLAGRFGTTYHEWRKKTPAFVPDFRLWTSPNLSFSAVMILRREYSGLFQIIAAFSLLNFVLHFMVTGQWILDPAFQTLLLGGLLFCAAIWVLVRWTAWLQSPEDAKKLVNLSASIDSQKKYKVT